MDNPNITMEEYIRLDEEKARRHGKVLMRYFSFGRHLDELHVTWAHLEKKQTRLRTNTKTLEDLCSQSLETASQAIHDAVTTHQGEGHMARQCTQPKRPRNSTWFKEKMLLVQAEEPRQTDDLDAYDSDRDDISSAKAVLMANLSSYDLDILSELIGIRKHDVISVVDEEETLILEEESRSKMRAKQNDLILKEKKINISLINSSELNKFSEDFGKCFVPQMQLSTEQAFWLPISNRKSEQLVTQIPLEIEVPKELPKEINNGDLIKP
ncbi:hypothetical protein Tco_1349798, partial [Tanacetum coccineum]